MVDRRCCPPMRSYQSESLDRAKARNTIVSIPTGYGKTLIAVRLMEHYIKIQPGLKVAFLVPTRALVEQQAEYCIEHCRDAKGNRIVVQRLVGEDQAQWTPATWDKAVSQCHVLLGTAAVFQKAFVTDKYVSLDRISLIIFDECHNAVGNSPMAAVMRDGVIPYVNSWARHAGLPRILGLTASFVNGNLRNMEKKRKDLEALLISTLFCPDVDSNLLRDETYELVRWLPDSKINPMRQTEAIAKHLDVTSEKVGALKDVQKAVRRSAHVLAELGSESLLYYVEFVIVQQIMDKALILEQLKDSPDTVRYAKSLKRSLPVLRTEMDSLLACLRSDPQTLRAPSQTNKLKRLLELLQTIFLGKPDTYRGIVFVEQVALVAALAKQINDFFGSLEKNNLNNNGQQWPKCGVVAGTGNQSQVDRQAQLVAFGHGKARILVTTAALEEGIDVSDCAFVIRFNSIVTTKAHIQGSGRARHPNAEIYYFENCPHEERVKEAYMLTIAGNEALALSAHEMQRSIAIMSRPLDKRHPYPQTTEDGIVNVFNCKQIFNTFCSMVLGKSISPKKELYKFREQDGHTRTRLCQIRFPTPRGWNVMREEDCTGYWEGVDLEDIFVAERVNGKKTASEKEEMAFVFVVVVELRMIGLLNAHNKPDKRFLLDIRRACALTEDPSAAAAAANQITIHNKVISSARF